MEKRKKYILQTHQSIMKLTDSDPEVAFRPKRRNMEYQFLHQQIMEINDREDLNTEEKKYMKDKLRSEYQEYDEKYEAYNRIVREYNMWTALSNLNKRMNWNNN